MATCNKRQLIDKACANLRGALEYWLASLPDDTEFGGVEVHCLDPLQSMHWRGDVEVYKAGEQLEDVEQEY